jgi:hypothetical protein
MPRSGLILFAVTALLPGTLFAFLSSSTATSTAFILIDNTILFTIPIALAMSLPSPASRVALAALSLCWTIRCFLLAIFLTYWIYTGHQFDLFFALDAAGDVPVTVGRLFPGGFFLLCSILAAASLLLFISEYRLLTGVSRERRIKRGKVRYRAITALAVVAVTLSPSPLKPLWSEVKTLPSLFRTRASIRPLFAMPEQVALAGETRPSVVFLQLESGNALALNGEAKIGDRSFPGNFTPKMKEIGKDGVFFPFVWSNSIQTSRSMVNALCSGTNNIGEPLSENPDKIPVQCLPELLQQNGYETRYYTAFDDLSYQGHDLLSQRIGFRRFVGGSIMPEDRKELEWGYDDCEFYQAVFADLRKSNMEPDGLFLYLAVNSHHYPFQTPPRYPEVHAFDTPTIFLEFYLNSALEQDHCLPIFYEEFQGFFKGRAHLFLYADHSVPVGTRGGTIQAENVYNENFAVPLAYIPPRTETGTREWRRNHTSHSQPALTDLPATVLELLSNTPQQNSFVRELVADHPGNAPYEECHTFVQPYGEEPQIAVVRFPLKHVYYAHSGKTVEFNLARDPGEADPRVAFESLEYQEFLSRFMCKRFLSGSPQR